MLILASLLGCDLSAVGVYKCDEYCDQVIAKTEVCGREQAASDCEAAGGTPAECSATSWEDVQGFAGGAREDWGSATKEDMVASCEDDIASSGKTDSACQAETGAINNLTCDQILDTIGSLAG